MAEVPSMPSLVAVIVAVPGETAVTSPEADTVATPGALEVHVMTRPVSVRPFASEVVAVSWRVVPLTTLAEPGLTTTVATGADVTLSGAFPLFPSLVAVMLAVPTETAVTSPAELTVATAELLEVHVTVRPVRALPFASNVTAVA